MKEFQSSGQFWRPGTPAEALWGKLRYVPGNATTLTLDGEIAGARRENLSVEIEELHGRLFNGTPCVLKDLWGNVESFIARDEFFRTLLHGQLLLFGIEPAEVEKDRFAMSSLKLSHLDDWFERPLRADYQHDSSDKCVVSFEPARSEARAEFEGEPFRLRVVCERTLPFEADRAGMTFTFDYKLLILPDHPQSLTWHMGIGTLLREFFMFLVGSGVYTLELKALLRTTPPEGEVHIFPTIAVPTIVRLEPVYFYSRHGQIRPHFEELLVSWLQNAETLVVVRHALSDLLTVDGTSPDAVFVRVVQTMEHMHGLVSPDHHRYVSKRVWRRFTGWLQEHFPECWAGGEPAEHAELRKQSGPLIGRIKGINSLSFRSRIRALFEAVPDRELMPLIGNPPNISEYLDGLVPRIEATRHYLTHFSSEQQERAFPSEELEVPTLQCWSVLIFTLARFLGLSDALAGDLALAARKTMFLVGTKTRL